MSNAVTTLPGMRQIEHPLMPGPDNFDFYRCRGCGRLLTRLDELRAFRTGDLCTCGHLKYSPAWPRWSEWLKPRILLYCLRKWQGFVV